MVDVEILQQKGHNFLWVDDYLWMWDIPEEQDYQREIAEKSFGDVLVAGYGLGLVQRYLIQNEDITSLLTVEKYPEVIEACSSIHDSIYGEIEFCDFFNFESSKRYDCVIGDIWKDQEEKYLPIYSRFKEKAATLLKPNGKILAWGESYFEHLLSTNGGDS